ncbi:YeeE/YedE family protein [Aurantibacillus circumpalustris]|uniref:YeeE/YedE family protein n=1 Tax=Aurantibacillus circumpalustris TaxID=3036359 RepID=UPI00295A9C13|nr:YeeE/YedE thiosulfate transporter family protein [Aurantibacillus circumpalustris]
MIEIIKQPWNWAVAGILSGLIVPALLLLGNKKLGVSSTFRDVCAMCVPSDVPFFNYDWKKGIWNMFFAMGLLLGGFLATQFLSYPHNIEVAEDTRTLLSTYGIDDFSQMMPSQLFGFENLFTFKGFIFFILGGFLVGFGTRYAGGCTSGHIIMGLSNLQIPSLIATCFFMIGGVFSANVLLPLIFKFL